MKQPVFLENLNSRWLLRTMVWRLFSGKGPFQAHREFYVIYEISHPARLITALLRTWGFRLSIHLLSYDFFSDVGVPGEVSALDEIYFKAAPLLVRRVEEGPEYGPGILRWARRSSHGRYLRAYLSKRIAHEMIQKVRSILIASWFFKKLRVNDRAAILYLEDYWLFDHLSEYAHKFQVELRPLARRSRRLREWAHSLKGFLLRSFHGVLDAIFQSPVPRPGPSCRIAVELYLSGSGRERLYNTDLFWYREPRLPPGSVFGYFPHPEDQPAKSRQATLVERGMDWAGRKRLRYLMYARPISPDGRLRDGSRDSRVNDLRETPGQQALLRAMDDFYAEYERWVRFFMATGTRIHVSTKSDYFPENEALHAAMEDAGGVSVAIQRSIELNPGVFRRTVVDVHFSFAKSGSVVERLSGSSIRQLVVAGYPFDDVFPEAKEYARGLVKALRSRGATFILSFFDQGWGVDPKSLGGGRWLREDYRFLCDRLSEDSTLGLILKPKRPERLPQLLGIVWPQVERLIDAGRCLLLESGSMDERYLPGVGACAANLAINLHEGATAGLESFLTGTRTLLMGHVAPRGVFERLPMNADLIFDSWEGLWAAVERFRANPKDPHIGNWEPIIEELVSFRDGRTSERIQEYLLKLHEAFQAGKSRDEALEYAAGRYTQKWAEGLIAAINWPSPEESPTPVTLSPLASSGQALSKGDLLYVSVQRGPAERGLHRASTGSARTEALARFPFLVR